MKLKIQASLVTREGFQKPIILDELKDIVHYPIFPKVTVGQYSTLDVPNEIGGEMTFQLEKTKEVKQKNGLTHIVAVYREI